MAERVVKLVRPRSKVASLPKEVREKRVAAYARVSTDSDEQMGSVEAQKDYFEKLIREKSGWTLVEVYADEGISGTSLNHREAFNRMIDDAMNGKIDLIVTKSLSRFARNTVDALGTNPNFNTNAPPFEVRGCIQSLGVQMALNSSMLLFNADAFSLSEAPLRYRQFPVVSARICFLPTT